MSPDPREQPGLRLRVGAEHRRISSQHRQLDALYELVVTALERGAPPDARRALERFCDAWDAHTSLEDGFYFPALRGLRPGLAPRLAAFVDDHVRFRDALRGMEGLVAGPDPAAARDALERFAAEVAEHERREEELARELEATGGGADRAGGG